MGSEARLSSWTLLVSGSYLKVLNMATDLDSVDESRMYVPLGKRWGCDSTDIKKTKRDYLLYSDVIGVNETRTTETVAS
jgi:hypothetical protein